MKKFSILIFVSIFSLFLVDNFIHFYPQHLPKKFINFLTHKAQSRAKLNNPELSKYIYEDFIFYAKPNTKFYREDGTHFQSDENGYISNNNDFNKGEEVDILVIGDSFTYELVKNLRTKLSNQISIYNIGFAGQGIYHWKYQYKRFLKINNLKKPELVLINYYEGNDLLETERALIFNNMGYKNSAFYPTNQYFNLNKFKRKISYFNEIKSIAGNLLFLTSSKFKKKKDFNCK